MGILRNRKKTVLIALLLMGVFLVFTTHSLAMSSHMSDVACSSKVVCGACAVPAVTDSPEIQIVRPVCEGMFEPGLSFPPLLSSDLYHPPR